MCSIAPDKPLMKITACVTGGKLLIHIFMKKMGGNVNNHVYLYNKTGTVIQPNI
jgi:hypothetical protein